MKFTRIDLFWKVIAWGVSLLLCGNANADNFVVPKKIYDYILAQGCEQVSDFFLERPEVDNGPYVRAHSISNENFSVWCSKDMDKKVYLRSYILLVHIEDKKNPLSKCSERIEGIDFIGGLSFEEIDHSSDLYYFHDKKISNAWEKIPVKGNLQSTAIKSVWDGTGNYFVCVEGRWANRPIH